MKQLLFIVPLLCAVAFAGPCVPGTLQNYIDLGAGGRALGLTSFADFTIVPGQSFATPIPASGIQVTPGGSAYSPSLAFTLGTTAAAGELFESFFRFSVAGPTVLNFALTLNGSSATGDGAVIATADICPGGSFSGVTPSGCPNTAQSFDRLQDGVRFARVGLAARPPARLKPHGEQYAEDQQYAILTRKGQRPTSKGSKIPEVILVFRGRPFRKRLRQRSVPNLVERRGLSQHHLARELVARAHLETSANRFWHHTLTFAREHTVSAPPPIAMPDSKNAFQKCKERQTVR